MEHDLKTVHVLGLPVALHRAATEAHEALMREFDIIEAGADPEAAPRRLLRLVEELRVRYEHLSQAPLAVLEKAFAGGSAQIDLEYLVPPSVAAACRELRTLLVETDEFCRRGGELLTLAPGPELVDYRNWFLDQFIEQVELEQAPRVWDGDVPTGATLGYAAAVTTADDPKTEDTTADHVPAGADHRARPSGRHAEATEATVALKGAIDLESSARIRSTITRLRRQGSPSIVLDLAAVDFVDSVGLGLLVSIQRRLNEEHRTLVLTAVGPLVLETLRIAGLEPLFTIRSVNA